VGRVRSRTFHFASGLDLSTLSSGAYRHLEHESHWTQTKPSFSVTVYLAAEPAPRPRFAPPPRPADFAAASTTIAPISFALTVTTRALGSRQFASHA